MFQYPLDDLPATKVNKWMHSCKRLDHSKRIQDPPRCSSRGRSRPFGNWLQSAYPVQASSVLGADRPPQSRVDITLGRVHFMLAWCHSKPIQSIMPRADPQDAIEAQETIS